MSNKGSETTEIANIVPLQNKYYTQTIVIFQAVYVIILIGTLILPFFLDFLGIKRDPAFIYFPYLVYIPNTLTIVLLLSAMKKFYLMQIGKTDSEYSRNYFDRFISSFQSEKNISGFSNILRRISILLTFFITVFAWFIGITTIPTGGESLLLSPMNLLTLSFAVSGLMIYIGYGIKRENQDMLLYLLLVFLANILFHILGVILTGDYLVLPMSLSYQVSAFVLVMARFTYFQLSDN
jgi:hypothetical protein